MTQATDNTDRRIAVVFHRRADEYAQRGRKQTALHDGLPVLVLRAGAERFGIQLSYVRQVFPGVPITPVPGAPSELIGIANLNGVPQSVFDFSRLLALSGNGAPAQYLILLRISDATLGLAVEGFDQVRYVDVDSLLADASRATHSAPSCILGVTEDRIAVIDPHKLIDLAFNKSFAADSVAQKPAAAPA